ncbi:hypothetical protein BJ875DRAFT_437813 [Amylocarpus encephaloides]|uniref:C2H2-type domain-containing protein n=1 Tax=Amylocarpus encephaloides TaxID=45428 RepID=A0A9P8C973_9HELO|nr:hypothetical protein BJ875DRAFT_437813 [Amylocarpus encephaloides]
MQPLSDDQASTLRRWVSHKGKRRPGKRDRDFLCEEKNLTSEQIDWWWENVDSSKCDEAAMVLSNQPGAGHVQDNHANVQSTQFPQPLFQPNATLQFQNMDYELYPPTREIQPWSPMGQPQQQESSPFPGQFNHLHGAHHSGSWSMGSGNQNRTTMSSASSVPFLSRTARSSMSSSIWTSDSASLHSTQSVYIPTTDDIMIDSTNCPEDQKFNSGAFHHNSISCSAPRFSCKSIPEEQTHFSAQQAPQIKTPLDECPPPVPPKPAKYQVLYSCTVCEKGFPRKDDWRRHEESHDPQTYWICMMDEYALLVPTGWLCAFCNTFKKERGEMTEHLLRRHKINECTNKHESKRKWHRKDKLKQHLTQVHHLADNSPGSWEYWNRDVTRKKWAWGCGYCGKCLFTWKGRNDHIAEHYEKEHITVFQWYDSRVIKALLKQAYPDFNVLDAWKVRNPNGDQHLEWSKADASTLRRKLEFHENTPEKIALEAQVLASEFMG